MSVLIEFFGRIGFVEQLDHRKSYQPKSPNHDHPGQVLVGFMLSVIAGAQRFAHANQWDILGGEDRYEKANLSTPSRG